MASQTGLNDWQIRYDGGDWEAAHGRLVSGGFFQVLGVNPLIGRVFTTAEDRAATPSAVLSYDYWQRRFGGRPDVLGRTIAIRQAVLTIIGVTPPGFIGETSGQHPDLWLPLRMQPGVIPGVDRLHDYAPQQGDVAACLRKTETRSDAGPGRSPGRSVVSSRAGIVLRGRRNRGAAARVSGPASSNPARAPWGPRGQRQEFSSFAHRAAGRGGRAAADRLCESGQPPAGPRRYAQTRDRACACRSAQAAAASSASSLRKASRWPPSEAWPALAMAYFFHGALVRMMAESDPRFQMSFTLDPLVLAFALRCDTRRRAAVRRAPGVARHQERRRSRSQRTGRGATASRGRMRSGRLLVSLQLALSLPLLVGAGLLARTVYNLQRADLGFPAQRLLLVRVDLREAGYGLARRESVLRRLLGQFQRIPGVYASSYSQLGVFTGGNPTHDRGGRLRAESGRRPRLGAGCGGPRLFLDVGCPHRAGARNPRRAIMRSPPGLRDQRSLCQALLRSAQPLGMHITELEDDIRTTFQVVGVTRNSRTRDLRGDIPAALLRGGNAEPRRREESYLPDPHRHRRPARYGGRPEDDSALRRRAADRRRRID